MHWRRKWQPTPVFLPGESQGRGAWWAAIYGVAQSWTRLKRLSSSRHMTLSSLADNDAPATFSFFNLGAEKMPFEWGAQDSQLCQTHSPVPKQPQVRTANVSHGNDGNSWGICLRHFAEEFSAVEVGGEEACLGVARVHGTGWSLAFMWMSHKISLQA